MDTQQTNEFTRLLTTSSVTDIESIWSGYFDGEYSADDRKAALTHQIVSCLQSRESIQSLSKVIVKNGIHLWLIEYSTLVSLLKSSSWQSALDSEPSEAICCVEAAVHQVLSSEAGRMIVEQTPLQVNVRIQNFHKSRIELRNLKANCLGRLVSISGVVVRASIVKPLVRAIQFACTRCQAVSDHQLTDGIYSAPTKCSTEGCRSRTFIPNRRQAMKVDFQKIRIQELFSSASRDEARIPRTVDCELTQDLTNCCLPGDLVTVCGIVKHINREMDVGGHGKHNNLYNLYISANSVVNKRAAEGSEHGGKATNVHFFPRQDLETIVHFVDTHKSDVFRQLVQSLCPTICGHELVKAGMILSLFGGVQKHAASLSKVPVRGDIHVLIVGDPGLGKSQLLRSASNCAPRGIYVCGNGSSAAGLTVAVVKDGFSGDFVFEAGAMVLANGGICCIDEFDKMPNEHQALLEAMEQQSVSVAKAGLVANLTAKTSVMAAANPAAGHYNRGKTVNENLKMSAALLSRFDLVFILLDRPDEIRDQRLSEHVMHLHSKSRDAAKLKSSRDANFLASAVLATQEPNGRPRLADRLQIQQPAGGSREFEPMTAQQLRKYIAYARQYVKPKLSRESCAILQSFYLQLRQHSRGADGTPITARQLESLVRLAEARARVDLRETVSAQDAQDVVDLMSESLYDKLVDENGRIDMARSGGMSKSKEIKRFMEHLCQLARMQDRPCFNRKELAEIADNIGLNVPHLDDVIEKMNEAGFLLRKGNGKFEVQP